MQNTGPRFEGYLPNLAPAIISVETQSGHTVVRGTQKCQTFWILRITFRILLFAGFLKFRCLQFAVHAMKKCTIERLKLDVAPIVVGTGAFGNLYQAHPYHVKMEVLKQWLQHLPKPFVIDTAGKYGAGLSLQVIGSALRDLNVSPDDVIVSNKLAWKRVPLTAPEPTFEPGAWVGIEHDAVQQISYQGILDCWNQGNEILGEGFDSKMGSVHDPDEYLAAAASEEDRQKRFEDILGAYKALGELKAKGEVLGIGVGSKDWKTIREICQHVDLDWVMFANSFTIHCHPRELLDFFQQLNQKNVWMINSAVFHGGFLLGGGFYDYVEMNPANPDDAEKFEWREKLNAICQRFSIKPISACTQFAFSPPEITSFAMATTSPARVASNVSMIQEQIPSEFWQALKSEGMIDAGYPYV